MNLYYTAQYRAYQSLRRALNKRLKAVNAAFDKHLGKTRSGKLRNSASSFCADCQHYWGEIKSLRFAIEITKKKPNFDRDLDNITNVEPG